MQWLNAIVDKLIEAYPDQEILVSSGVSPSGTYHLGTLREVLTAEAIMREIKRRGGQARHLHVVDDLDVFRKVPVGIPAEYEKYLGMPLCDIPAPDDPKRTYADYYLHDLLEAAKELKLEMEVMRAHEKYRSGFFVPAIEKALSNIPAIRKALEDISGRALEEQWSPVQVIEGGYLKNRPFVSIDANSKTIVYTDKDGQPATAKYDDGNVKLNWRIDWPARWSLLGVKAEPFGRDHATKGGSYDTGVALVRNVFGAEPPVPVPYNFINRTGDTKKMSKSKGDTVTAAKLLQLLPPEIVWYFILRFSPEKTLFFDEGPTLIKLVDDFAELSAKPDKSESEKQLLDLCGYGLDHFTVSRVPFSHLVASYQAALRNPERTLEVIARTEHGDTVSEDRDIIINELKYIDSWLDHSAPDDVKFTLQTEAVPEAAQTLSDAQKQYLSQLADKITAAPADADGEWFHKAIYEFKDTAGLKPSELFSTLYTVLINQTSGPRAGWFLSLLDRDWLVKRLRLQA